MTPSKSSVEQTSEAQQQKQQDRANTTQDTVLANNADLNGAVQNTGYYKNQVQSGTDATTTGYDASRRNLKASMEAAGVTGRSGVAGGADTALGAQEAADLARVRTNAYADTKGQQLAADQQDLTISGQESGSASGYNSNANQAEIERQKIGSANWAALGSAVSSAASPWSAGLSKKTLGA